MQPIYGLHRPPEGLSFSWVFEYGFRALYLVLITVSTVAMLVRYLAAFGQVPWVTWIAILAMIAAVGACLASAAGTFSSRFTVPVVTVIEVVSIVVVGLTLPVSLHDMWPTAVIIALEIYTFQAGKTSWRWLAPSIMFVVSATMHVVTGFQVDAFSFLFDVFAQIGMFASTLILLDGLRRAGEDADAVLAEKVAIERRTSDAKARAQAREESERLIHDTVVHGLRAVALTGRGLTVEEARAACDEAMEGLERHHQESRQRNMRAAMESVAARQPINVFVHGKVNIDDPVIIQAFADATEEALRNVARHAGVDTATVTMHSDGRAITVEVKDEGAGFDPQVPKPGHRGITESIMGRLAAIDGHAEVVSLPGKGTTVTLSWLPRRRDTMTALMTQMARTISSIVSLAPLPTLIVIAFGSIPSAIVMQGLWPVLMAVWFLLLVGLVLAYRYPRGEMSLVLAYHTLAASVGGAVVNLLVINEADSRLMTGVVAASMLLVPVIALTKERTGIITLSIFAGVVAVTAMIHFGPLVLVTDLAGVSLTLICTLGWAMVGRHFVKVQAQAVEERTAFAQAVHEREEIFRQRAISVDHRLLVLDDSTDLLTGVRQGTLDPADPEVVDEAKLLEFGVRDALQVHGLIPTKARAAFRSARGRAWKVVINMSEAVMEGFENEIVSLLDRLPAEDPGEITFSVAGDDLTIVLVSPKAHLINLDPCTDQMLDEGMAFAIIGKISERVHTSTVKVD